MAVDPPGVSTSDHGAASNRGEPVGAASSDAVESAGVEAGEAPDDAGGNGRAATPTGEAESGPVPNGLESSLSVDEPESVPELSELRVESGGPEGAVAPAGPGLGVELGGPEASVASADPGLSSASADPEASVAPAWAPESVAERAEPGSAYASWEAESRFESTEPELTPSSGELAPPLASSSPADLDLAAAGTSGVDAPDVDIWGDGVTGTANAADAGSDGAAAAGLPRLRARPTRPLKAQRGLRVHQRLWSLDPWSVLKVSALFYFCVCLIMLVAVTLLWNVGRSVGTIDDLESFITRMGAYGTCTPKAEVKPGTDFKTDHDCPDGQVLVGGFKIDDGTLFKTAAISGGIIVVAGSVGNLLLVVLLNLLNELTGGVRYTIVKEPTAPSSGAAPRHRSRDGRRSGSPREPVQG